MLYVTTRNNRETYTAQRSLTEDRAEDGGFYVPLREPSFTAEEVAAWKAMPFNQRIPEILNRLFQTQLTRWDVDFSVGRHPVKLVPLRNRIVMGEFWHNPDWNYAKMEAGLSGLLRKDGEEPGSWLRIAIRAALLAASSLELSPDGVSAVDMAMVSGDFLWPISAVYARSWGFPVGNIIMCCNENKGLWELLCYGQLKTDVISTSTELPEADIALPAELERLIYACGGPEETEKYLQCCRSGATYFAEGAVLSGLREGNYVSVVSSHRIREILSGAFRTHHYLLTPAAALAYGGLLDYRSKSGCLRPALVICESRCDVEYTASALEIPVRTLEEYME